MARFTNQAQLRYGNSIANSNIAVGEILEVLSATKTAITNSYSQNDNMTYIISIVNSGTVPFSGISVTDNLGAYLSGTESLTPLTYNQGSIKYYINGVLQPSPVVQAGPPMVVSGISIPAGGNVSVVYETTVNEYAPPAAGASITNTAIIAGTEVTPVTVEETIQSDNKPLLTITKAVSPVPVTENGTLTYTFTIQNTGNTVADETVGIVVTDIFDPLLSNLSVTFNGAAWSVATHYSYDTATGLFTTGAGQITVPAATYTQDPVTNAWSINPGISTLVVTGTV